MNCCIKKEDEDLSGDSVHCEICEIPIMRSVAAVMYLNGKDHFFCSIICQDKWEEQHPEKIW